MPAFLRKQLPPPPSTHVRRNRPSVCVCHPPVPKGFTSFPYFHTIQQGATSPFISLWPTKLLIFGEDMNLGRQVHVPATGLNFCPRCSNLSCLLPWWFHGTSPKPFPSAAFSCRVLTACECLSTRCSTIQFCGLMHLSVLSPSFSAWELS